MLGNALSGLGSGLIGNTKVVKHARGGVVTSPTTFPMQGNTIGIAGEAGTEVIAPAVRMSNGDVGVGAVAPKVTVNNYTNAAVEVIHRPNNEAEIKITELNAMLSSSKSNKGMASAQRRMGQSGRQIG
jgi:phage-related minor tail protein